MDNYQYLIREFPDFPQKGILFYDINPLLSNWKALNATSFSLAEKIVDIMPFATKTLSIEARGFIIGGILSTILETGFVPIRKKGKLPTYDSLRSIEYQLEYGTDSLSMDISLINYHDKIIVFDDVLATGGTAEATYKLLENEMKNGNLAPLNKNNICFAFLLEIEKLKGRTYLSQQTGISENNIISLIMK
jgi:adenine phosphoribosyltransferase